MYKNQKYEGVELQYNYLDWLDHTWACFSNQRKTSPVRYLLVFTPTSYFRWKRDQTTWLVEWVSATEEGSTLYYGLD